MPMRRPHQVRSEMLGYLPARFVARTRKARASIRTSEQLEISEVNCIFPDNLRNAGGGLRCSRSVIRSCGRSSSLLVPRSGQS